MKDFPLVTSAALLYWGYFSGNFFLSVIFSILTEMRRFVSFRLDFGRKDFDRISLITTISLIGFLVYYVNSSKAAGLFLSIFEFIPIALFPLYILYLYSSSDHVNAKRFFLLFVVNKYSSVHPYIRKFRPDHLYFACLVTAIGVRADIKGFYFIAALLLPVLYRYRSSGHSILNFLTKLAAAFLLALIIQSSMFYSFSFMRNFLTELYLDRFFSNREKNVRLGNIADLKSSFLIEIRAEAYKPYPFGFLIRDRIFDSYNDGIWSEQGSESVDFIPDLIDYETTEMDSLRIFFFARKKSDPVRMPFGTYDFAGIEAGKLSLNTLGNATVSYTQYLVDYKAYHRNFGYSDLIGTPGETDRAFPLKDSIYTDSLIDKLGLYGMGQDRIFTALRNYFIEEYRYSLDYINWPRSQILDKFAETRSGHCELFATLSVLTYRRLGYHSRYVTGYYMSEYSTFQNKFIGRRKDRHAWLIVWDEDLESWKEYDTTPPDITAFRTNVFFFEKIYDMISYSFHSVFMFRKENEGLFENILLFSLIPLGLFLLFRLMKDVRPQKTVSIESNTNLYKKIPELEKIDSRMILEGFVPDNETVSEWFRRLKDIVKDPTALEVITKLYYSKRYGGCDLTEDETGILDEALERTGKRETES